MLRRGAHEGRLHRPRLQGLQTLHLPLREGDLNCMFLKKLQTNFCILDSKPLALISQRGRLNKILFIHTQVYITINTPIEQVLYYHMYLYLILS